MARSLKRIEGVEFQTAETIFEKGKHREVLVSICSPNIISLRLKGLLTRFEITAGGAYHAAVKATVAANSKQKGSRRGGR